MRANTKECQRRHKKYINQTDMFTTQTSTTGADSATEREAELEIMKGFIVFRG